MALEQLVNGMTGQQLANTIKNNFEKVLDVESAENKAENAGKALKTDYDATRYVEMELADGTPIRMRWDVFCQAIASVVAERMRANSSYPYMFRGFVSDANEAKDSGCYRINSSSTNVSTQYGILEVDKTSDYILQRCYSAGTKTNVYVRMFFDNTWSEWQQL